MSRQRDVRYTPKAKTRRQRSARRLGHTGTLETRVASAPLRLSPARTTPRRRWNGVISPRFISMLVIFSGLWAIYLLFGQPTFYVYGADIRGNQVVSATEIYQAAGIDSTSIFWVNPRTVQANITALAYIKSAEVSVKLPAQVRITVDERLPQVLWRSGDQIFWVDAEGVFLPAKTEAISTGIELQIEDVDRQALKQIDPRIIRAAQRVYRYKPALNHLYYQRDLGLLYPNEQGWSIYLGKDDSNISAKLRVADALTQALLAQGIAPTYIDVRDPLHAFYDAP